MVVKRFRWSDKKQIFEQIPYLLALRTQTCSGSHANTLLDQECRHQYQVAKQCTCLSRYRAGV